MARYVGIDPSTKTGVVALDEDGEVWEASEIQVGLDGRRPDTKHMLKLINGVLQYTTPDDRLAIEGFGFASRQGFLLGGIGWGLRIGLYVRGTQYIEIAPNQLKKFVGVTGWVGEPGSKRRLTESESKKAVKQACREIFNFSHKSHNVVDAYVLAQIARALHEPMKLTAFQREVIQTLKGC